MRVVAWVESMAEILKIVELLMKLGWVDEDLLHYSIEMILLRDYLISCLEPHQFLSLFL
jgi:hypothetical protein